MFLVNTWLKITEIFRIKAINYHQTSLLLTAREVTYRILYLVATQILKNYSMTGGGIHPLSPIACHLGPSKNSYPKLPGLIIEKQPNSSGPRYFFLAIQSNKKMMEFLKSSYWRHRVRPFQVLHHLSIGFCFLRSIQFPSNFSFFSPVFICFPSHQKIIPICFSPSTPINPCPLPSTARVARVTRNDSEPVEEAVPRQAAVGQLDGMTLPRRSGWMSASWIRTGAPF